MFCSVTSISSLDDTQTDCLRTFEQLDEAAERQEISVNTCVPCFLARQACRCQSYVRECCILLQILHRNEEGHGALILRNGRGVSKRAMTENDEGKQDRLPKQK